LNEREWPRVTRAYGAADLTFSVRAENDDVADYVEGLLASLTEPGTADHCYSIVDDGARFKNRYALYFDGQPIVRTPFEALTVAFLLWHLNFAVVAASHRYLVVHAAAATHNGSAILLPAAPNSGKTTLVARLVARGYGYLTDEASAIDPVSLAVAPYPKPMVIERGSWEVLADLRTSLDDRFSQYTQDVWHLVPDSDAVAEPSVANLVVSPHFDAGATTALEPITRAEAVLLLAENAFNFDSHKANGLDILAAVVRRCECYRLTIGANDDGSDAVMRVVERLGATG
jgi:HprK-related kinase A